jgi:hypothetical protein
LAVQQLAAAGWEAGEEVTNHTAGTP